MIGWQTVNQRTISVLSFLYPISSLISYFRPFLSLSFLLFHFPFLFFLVLSFPLSFFLSFFLSCVGVPVPCVPGVPVVCVESYFLISYLLFYPHVFVCYPYAARMNSYVTRMFTRMYSYVFVCHRCVPVCARMLLVCSRMLLVCIPGTVNSRLLHGNLISFSTRDNSKSQSKSLARSMTSLQYLLNFAPTLDNLKSFQWTRNSRIL